MKEIINNPMLVFVTIVLVVITSATIYIIKVFKDEDKAIEKRKQDSIILSDHDWRKTSW